MLERKNIDDFLAVEFSGSHPEFVNEGWTSFAFLLNGNIIRIPRNTEYIKEYELDAAICRFVRPFVDVQIPEIKVVHRRIPYAVHREIKGRTWDKDYALSLSNRAQDILAADCAKFLAQCHAIDCSSMQKEVSSLRFEADDGLDLEKCAEAFHGFLSRSKIEKLISKYADASKKKQEEYVFCHRDFSGHNSVLDGNGRLCGVFDFGGAGFAVPEYDFIRLYNLDVPSFFNKITLEYQSISGRKIIEETVLEQCLLSNVAAAYWLNEDVCLAPIREQEMNEWVIQAVQKHL